MSHICRFNHACPLITCCCSSLVVEINAALPCVFLYLLLTITTTHLLLTMTMTAELQLTALLLIRISHDTATTATQIQVLPALHSISHCLLFLLLLFELLQVHIQVLQ